MATILEYSDHPLYTIKTVAAQTGIRPVTLRAWERRYDVLDPHRSENHYRLYSERDVAILRWIRHRIDAGLSISGAVNELKDMRQHGIYPEPIPSQPALATKIPTASPKILSSQLFDALVRHDELKADEIMQEIQAGYELMTMLTEIITPSLVKIGEAWYRGEVQIATEHFASAFIRAKMITLLQTFPNRRNAPLILVGCAPDEFHEIGSLMMAVVLRSDGYRVEYLGPDIPIEDLVEYAIDQKPAMVILTATDEQNGLALANVQERLGRVKPRPLFGYAGQAFRKTEIQNQVPGIYIGKDFELGLQNVKKALPQD